MANKPAHGSWLLTVLLLAALIGLPGCAALAPEAGTPSSGGSSVFADSVGTLRADAPTDAALTDTPAAPQVKLPTRTPSRKATRTATVQPGGTPTPALADFDFFVLALSYSPDYCAANGASDPQQCALGKKLGFVLHGLWPQYNRGYPSNCSTQSMPQRVKDAFPGLYPSTTLYGHEWSKHGTCSGLSPTAYLTLTQQLKQSVRIPADYRSPAQAIRVTAAAFKRAFAQVNAALSAEDIAVHCSGSGRFLQEMYVCFARDGQPTACSAELQRDAAKSCGNPDFVLRPAQ